MRRSRRIAVVAASVAATFVVSSANAWAADPVFELGGTGTSTVTGKALANGSVMQSFAADPVASRLYFGQIKSASTGDMTLTQTDLTGRKLGSMTVRGGGHAWAIGVENVNGKPWLYTEAEARPDAAGQMFGTSIARFPYSAGSSVDLTYRVPSRIKVAVFRVPACLQYIAPSVDPAHGQMGVACRGSDGLRHFYVYSLPEFLGHVYNPVASGILTRTATDQGWTLYGDFIYQIQGDAYSASNPQPGNTMLTSRDLTGAVIQTAAATDAVDLTFREPEGVGVVPVGGVPHLAYGLASGVSGDRRANVIVK